MQARVEELKAGFEVDKEEMERIAGEGREKDAASAAQQRSWRACEKRTEGGDEMKGTATGKPLREAKKRPAKKRKSSGS